MVGLTYAVSKVRRAESHLKRLDDEIRMFLDLEPVTCTVEDEPENGICVFRFHVKNVPGEIPLLLGELAYNLRSSLDQLAWQLALLSGHTPLRATAFPIHSDRTKGSEDRFRRVTWDIPCEAIEIIKSLQPYERGNGFDGHPLWRLNELCNIDKHMTIPVNGTIVDFATGPADCCETFSWGRTDDGAIMGIPLEIKDKVYFKPSPPELVFGRPSDEPGTPFEIKQRDIAEIHEFVRDSVIPRFERFFT